MIPKLTTGVKISIAVLVITILTLFAGIVTANAIAQKNIQSNTKLIEGCESALNGIRNEVMTLKIDMATIQTQYGYIKETLERIEERLQ